jgi:heme-degrading monooxygenase HmoA
MVESAVTIMHPTVARQKDFEKFISVELHSMMKAKGMQGGLLMRYKGEPPTYLTITFWESRGDWYSCMQDSKLRDRARSYLLKNPRTRWYQTLARAQGSEFKRSRA